MVLISVTATLVEELHLDRQHGQKRRGLAIDDTFL
jgi:hypothetical protein